ncbi:MAG: hypothetical protein M3Q29_08445 [Chloroflexota bacterium]|nr:hypothetical protein [Chloroflexota bacterium]
MKRLFALALLALGWLAVRGRQLRSQGQVPAPPVGQAGNSLSEVAADVRAGATQVQQTLSSTASSTQETARQKVEQLRSAMPTPGSGGSTSTAADATTTGQPPQSPPPPAEQSPLTAMAATEQPPDDVMLVPQGAYPEDSFPRSTPLQDTYASESTGPEDAAMVSSTTPVAESTVAQVDDLPDPLQSDAPPTPQDMPGPGATISGTYVTDAQDATPEPVEPGNVMIFRAADDDTGTASTSAAQATESTRMPLDASSSFVTVDNTTDADAGSTAIEQASTATADQGSATSMDTDAASQAGQSEDASETEGLLLDPDATPSLDEGSDTQYSGSTVTLSASDSHAPTGSADTVQQPSEARVINTGDRLYNTGQDSRPGPEDTEDTATEIGRPGPAANAKREEMHSIPITPPGMTSLDEYQTTEASLPPETIEAMQRLEQGDVQQPDLPIREGYDVEATDGKVGKVDSVVRSQGPTESYMVVKEGLVFKSDVSIPFSAVDRVEGDTVYLKIEKQYIKIMEGQDTFETGGPTTTIGTDRTI